MKAIIIVILTLFTHCKKQYIIKYKFVDDGTKSTNLQMEDYKKE